MIVESSAWRRSTIAVASPARVLRWVFRREEQTVSCELSLTVDESAYELRVQPPWNPTGATTELFDDAQAAFQRHGAIERMLVKAGWTLESFESRREPSRQAQSASGTIIIRG